MTPKYILQREENRVKDKVLRTVTQKKVYNDEVVAQEVAQSEGVSWVFLESIERTELWKERKDSSFEKSQQNLKPQQTKGNANGIFNFSTG